MRGAAGPTQQQQQQQQLQQHRQGGGGNVLSMPIPMPVQALGVPTPGLSSAAGAGVLAVCGLSWPWMDRRLCVHFSGIARHVGEPATQPSSFLLAAPTLTVVGALPSTGMSAAVAVRSAGDGAGDGATRGVATSGGLSRGALWFDTSPQSPQQHHEDVRQRDDAGGGERDSSRASSAESATRRRLSTAFGRSDASNDGDDESDNDNVDDGGGGDDTDGAFQRRKDLEPPGRFDGAAPSVVLPDVSDAMPTQDGGVWWCVGRGGNVITRSDPGAPLPAATAAVAAEHSKWTTTTTTPWRPAGGPDVDSDDDGGDPVGVGGDPILPFDAMVMPGHGRWGFAPSAAGFGEAVVGHPGAAVATNVDTHRYAVLDPRLPGLPATTLKPLVSGAEAVPLGVRAVAVTAGGVVVVGTSESSLLLFDLRMAGAAAKPMAVVAMPTLPGPEPRACLRHVCVDAAAASASEPVVVAAACSDVAVLGHLDTVRGQLTGLGGEGPAEVLTTGSNITALALLHSVVGDDGSRRRRPRTVTVALADDDPSLHIWVCRAS